VVEPTEVVVVDFHVAVHVTSRGVVGREDVAHLRFSARNWLMKLWTPTPKLARAR
jgi:hypothetical protein